MSTKKKRTLWDLFDAYNQGIEEWMEEFGETIVERPSWSFKNCTIEPLRHMMVTPSEVVITVDLPYTRKEDVKVKTLSRRTLEVSAKMTRKIKFKELGIHYCEGEFQLLHSQIHIPLPVETDQMKTSFKKGILEIRLPRKHVERIPVE